MKRHSIPFWVPHVFVLVLPILWRTLLSPLVPLYLVHSNILLLVLPVAATYFLVNQLQESGVSLSILITCLLDSVWVLLREGTCWSFLGWWKGLAHRSFVLREFSLILYVQYSGLVSVWKQMASLLLWKLSSHQNLSILSTAFLDSEVAILIKFTIPDILLLMAGFFCKFNPLNPRSDC